MRKVFVLTSFFLFLFNLQSETANAAGPSCKIEVSAETGFSSETKFSASGTSKIQLNSESRIDIVDETRKTIFKSLGFSTLGKNSFSINEFGPFPNEGKYHLNLIVPTSGSGQAPLCHSDTIKILPLLTPTPGGPTPAPTEPPSPLPPCSQWGGLGADGYVPISPADVGKVANAKCLIINTAIGPISTEPQGFVRRIFSLVLGLAGGISLILIMISGYKFMASQGNPEALTAARQQLVSAIIGLLFIIFSFVILQVIGVDILKIPGFQP